MDKLARCRDVRGKTRAFIMSYGILLVVSFPGSSFPRFYPKNIGDILLLRGNTTEPPQLLTIHYNN